MISLNIGYEKPHWSLLYLFNGWVKLEYKLNKVS